MDNYFFLIIAIFILNISVFVVYGVDKFKAKKNLWRIPEATLLVCALFGPIGAILGMKVWHHKTKKPKFFITVPTFLIVEIILVVLYFAGVFEKLI